MLGWGNRVFSSVSSVVSSKSGGIHNSSVDSLGCSVAVSRAREPFLRIPPFPGARVWSFCKPGTDQSPLQKVVEDLDQGSSPNLVDHIKRLRVGGTYWATQPELPSQCLLVRTAEALPYCVELCRQFEPVLWHPAGATAGPGNWKVVVDNCDPWHMVAAAGAIISEPHDELRLVAAIAGIPLYLFDRSSGSLELDSVEPTTLLGQALVGVAFEDPFTGKPISPHEAVELAGFWRRLIDSNRDLAGGLGFAFWKQRHVAPLLWGGANEFSFPRSIREAPANAAIAVWRAKTSGENLMMLEKADIALVEVEDGFLRSRGLGADCVPPLSITVDRLGPHFDPAQPSELEQLLIEGEFGAALLDRARRLRRVIVESGLGKYDRAAKSTFTRGATDRRYILVPGQVEDDRSVLSGGCGLVSNLELVARVRAQAPEAHILYKPHPDVLAGHRRGSVPQQACLEHADEIVGDVPFSSLIDGVDEVHVNTSLAGFEALLRGKTVTTYGVPFYAGWGLTRDLGPVPVRRARHRTIDELVAAALLLYPRYLDPLTKLPCPAEVVVARLCADEIADTGVIVGVRRLQGKIMRHMRSLVQ